MIVMSRSWAGMQNIRCWCCFRRLCSPVGKGLMEGGPFVRERRGNSEVEAIGVSCSLGVMRWEFLVLVEEPKGANPPKLELGPNKQRRVLKIIISKSRFKV